MNLKFNNTKQDQHHSHKTNPRVRGNTKNHNKKDIKLNRDKKSTLSI